MTEPIILVRFLRIHAPFNSGEVAGFTEVRAKQLVLGGAARYVEPPSGHDVHGAPLLPAPVFKKGSRGIFIVGDREIKGKADAWAEWSRVTGLPLPDGIGDDA